MDGIDAATDSAEHKTGAAICVYISGSVGRSPSVAQILITESTPHPYILVNRVVVGRARQHAARSIVTGRLPAGQSSSSACSSHQASARIPAPPAYRGASLPAA